MHAFDIHQPLLIETDRADMFLGQMTLDEVPILFRLIDSDRPHLSQYDDNTAGKYPSQKAVAETLKNWKRSPRLRMGIWIDYGHTLAGVIHITPTEAQVAQIGYWVGSPFCSKGVATAAVKALIAYTTRHYAFREIRAATHAKNEASTRVLLKAGFTEFKTSADDERAFTYAINPFDNIDWIVAQLRTNRMVENICIPTKSKGGGHTRITFVRIGDKVTAHPLSHVELFHPDYLGSIKSAIKNAGWNPTLADVIDEDRRALIRDNDDPSDNE